MDNGGRGTEAQMFEHFNNLEIENQKLRNALKWIKTSERLPEYGEHVLILLKWDNEPFMAFRSYPGWECVFPEMGEIKGDAYFDGFFKEDKNLGIEVTHWQLIELSEDNF